MSGTNPFRRKGTAEQSSNAPPRSFDHVSVSSNPDSGIPPIDTDIARPTKTKTVKTVRIISPHSAEEHEPSPDDFYNLSHRVSFSPPPDPALVEGAEDDSPEDPFGPDSEGVGSGTDDEGTRLNTQANTGESFQSAHQSPTGMPANPFKKTLQSLENQGSLGIRQTVVEQKSHGSNNTPAKPQYDVDDFKRLLLTGEKSASKPSITNAPPVSFGQIQNGDSSSNTDASSVSRQSIFEPTSSVLRESPRTSQEILSSDDERQRLVGASEPKTVTLKPRPFTPKHRHGRPMQADGPQTVSFEDPTLSFSSPVGATTSSGDQHNAMSPSSPSDKNKALPAIPFPSTSTAIGAAQGRSRPESYAEPRDVEASSISQKKPAPAPPPSRRSRPMSIGSINSGRSIPISEEITAEPIQMASSPPNKPLSAPAPPPPRRSNTFRGDSSSSTATIPSVSNTSNQSIPREQSPTPSQKARPPVPLARSPTVSASKGPNRTSPASGSPSVAPPPPPPPRRRGSSQSSNNYTPSRLSGSYTMPATERVRSDSGASSISQLPMTNLESNSEQKLEEKDVIADLTALQREVDELRGKIR